jgi:POT family proton-dependent oligopeptide transporter
MVTTPATAPADGPELPTAQRPRWFRTLFITDLWERFGFFGLQSLMVLFVSTSTQSGGLGLPTAEAAALTGSWIGLTFMLGGPGGWVGDRLLGVRPTMVLGGVVIVAGHFALALPAAWSSALGLVLVSAGTGLYKPNHQAITNMMYGDSDRREAGLSWMFMGVQIGTLLAPLVVGLIGEMVSFRLGFTVTGVVMAIGVAQLMLGVQRFGGVGERPTRPLDAAARARLKRRTLIISSVVVVLGMAAAMGGALTVGMLLALFGMAALIAPIWSYISLYRNKGLRPVDRARMRAFLWILVVWTMFFMIVAQGGSVLLLFAKDSTDRELFGLTVPTSWFQAANPFFLLVLSPVFAWALPRIKGGLPIKFSIALTLGGGSFVLMAWAASFAMDGAKVSPLWLMVVFAMQACGELVIMVVAIAAASEILPRAYISQVIGLLSLFGALGGGLGSQIVLLAQNLPAVVYYLTYGLAAVVLGVVVGLRRKSIARGLELTATAPEAETIGSAK